MSTDLKSIKKNISENWVNSFTSLIAYNQNKFYKIVGCVIIGIEAVNIPNIEGYKPHFVIYPLWKKNMKECLETPYVYISIKNNKGADVSIAFTKHQELFPQAVDLLNKQIPFSLNNNIELKLFFKFIDNLFEDFVIKSNPGGEIGIRTL